MVTGNRWLTFLSYEKLAPFEVFNEHRFEWIWKPLIIPFGVYANNFDCLLKQSITPSASRDTLLSN